MPCRVPARGARTFLEAVQALWFGHVLTCGEDGINANSLGRLDQIFFPYYEQYRASGLITRDEALELMQSSPIPFPDTLSPTHETSMPPSFTS